MFHMVRDIFTTSNRLGFDDVLNGVLPNVSEEINAGLFWPFTAEEVQKALHQMAPFTALGPDRMSPMFYKYFWHIVGSDVTKAVLTTLNFGFVPESINTIFIALIPKIKDHKNVSDFRPISLCNRVYKLIAKVLVNRLKLILPYVVSDSQSTFETLHYLKQKT